MHWVVVSIYNPGLLPVPPWSKCMKVTQGLMIIIITTTTTATAYTAAFPQSLCAGI